MEHEIERYPGELRKLREALIRLKILPFDIDTDTAGGFVAAVHIIAGDALATDDQGLGEHPAKYTVFWPGQTVYACQTHFDGLKHLNAAMGGATLDYREEAGNQCGNCVNEAKKDRG